MDLELKHIGQTLAIGWFTLYGLFHLIGFFRPSVMSGFNLLSAGQKLHESAMILAIVFAVGILVEDVSKNIVSERSILTKLADKVIDRDRELRLDSLFEVRAFSEREAVVKPEPIYTDLMRIDHKDPVFKHHSGEVKKILSPTNSGNDGYITIGNPDALVDEINRIYYSAITRVYQENNYYRELQGIQYRADFSRSLAFICLLYAALYLMLAVASYLPRKLKLESASRQLKLFSKGRRRLRWYPIQKLSMKRATIFLMLLLYLAGVVLAKTSYKSEMTNYNLRVFGYYTSIVITDAK